MQNLISDRTHIYLHVLHALVTDAIHKCQNLTRLFSVCNVNISSFCFTPFNSWLICSPFLHSRVLAFFANIATTCDADCMASPGNAGVGVEDEVFGDDCWLLAI